MGFVIILDIKGIEILCEEKQVKIYSVWYFCMLHKYNFLILT